MLNNTLNSLISQFYPGLPIDTTALNKNTDNYVMIYKTQLDKFIFVPSSDVLGFSDEDNDVETIDFGTF